MLKYIIFIFPILLNYLMGGMYFITAYRLDNEAHASKLMMSSTAAVWAIIYAITSYIIGKVVNDKRALPLVIAGAFVLTLSSIGFIIFDGIYTQFVWIVGYGIGAGLYCTPFQVFMKRVGGGGQGILFSTCLYTMAWSFGQATGPFVFGCIDRWQNGYVLSAIFGSLMGILAFGVGKILDAREKCAAALPEKTKQSVPATDSGIYSGRPDLVRLGWFGVLVGTGCYTVLRPLGQVVISQAGFDKGDAGNILGLILAGQALIALCFAKNKSLFMYHPVPNIVTSLSGMAGILLFAWGTSKGAFYFGALAFSLYSAYFYVMLVFHALVHPTKSGRYAATNEIMVGIATILCGVIGGWAADLLGVKETLMICAGIILLGSGIQASWLAVTWKNFKKQA